MVLGQYSAKIGPKKRISIPSKFIKELGEQVILAKWYEDCLVIVSTHSWRELLKRLTGEARIVTQPVRDIDRFILGSAFEVEPDGQGRIVIPEFLAEFANLSEEVVFLGLGDRIEVWDKKIWEDKQKTIQKDASEAIEKIAKS